MVGWELPITDSLAGCIIEIADQTGDDDDDDDDSGHTGDDDDTMTGQLSGL
jgi:hypothetical protein